MFLKKEMFKLKSKPHICFIQELFCQIRDGKEFTKKGHTLDDPELRSADPSPQRDLPPLSNCIIRLLVNATCVWIASSNDKVSTTIKAKLYKQ